MSDTEREPAESSRVAKIHPKPKRRYPTLRTSALLLVSALMLAGARNAIRRNVLLWETCLIFLADDQSIAERYAAMLQGASRHFEQNTPAALDRRFEAID